MIFFFFFLIHSTGITPNFTCVRALQSRQLRLGEAKHVVWCTVTIWHFLHVSGGISQVAVWLPIKNEPWLLNYRLALLAMMAILMCHSPLSLSKSLCPPPPHLRLASLSLFPSHLLLPSSLYPSISRLTAIRHWPCSLCLLPLPQVQPSHNYFLWFTVVGHCHPPKVFTAEITHTVFPNQTCLLCSIILYSVQRLWWTRA